MRLVQLLALCAISFSAIASEPATSPASASSGDDKALSDFVIRFKTKHPATQVTTVRRSPIPNLYEVVMGRNIAYVDESGRYALFGNVFDMDEQRDLTAGKLAALDRVEVSKLPRKLAIRQVKGDGKRLVVIFADPQCGYCKQMEQELDKATNITIETYILPILGPESARLSRAITCAADPGAAWSAWMLKSEQPPSPPDSCVGSGPEVAKFADSQRIKATPTLVSADGRRNAGAMTAEKLAGWLDAAPTASTASGRVVQSVATPTNLR